MTEHFRNNFRHRAIASEKPLTEIPDIVEFYHKEERENRINNNSRSTNGAKFESADQIYKRELAEVDKIFALKKEIAIPSIIKAKEEQKTTITSVDISSFKKRKFTQPSLYIRPSYVTDRDTYYKGYEIAEEDMAFIKQVSISATDFEQIVTQLESLADANEMISEEIAIDLLVNQFPHIDHSHYKTIYKYWKFRREENKKSLLRIFWRTQKYTDERLEETFKQNKDNKMKTRRYQGNEYEFSQVLNKIKFSQENYLFKLFELLNAQEQRKKVLLKADMLEWKKSVSSKFNYKITGIDQEWRELSKNIPKMPGFKEVEEEFTEPTYTFQQKVEPKIEEPVVAEQYLTRKRPREEKQKKKTVKEEQPKKKKKLPVSLRVRSDRLGRLVIDRLSSNNCFSPFDREYLKGSYPIYSSIRGEDSQEVPYNKVMKNYYKDSFLDTASYNDDRSEDEERYSNEMKTFEANFKMFMRTVNKG